MRWIQSLLVLFLLPGLPLFQMDQAIDIEWLICENSSITKSEINGPFVDQSLCFGSKPELPLFDQIRFNFQSGDFFSGMFIFFKGTSNFNRSPPRFHPSLS